MRSRHCVRWALALVVLLAAGSFVSLFGSGPPAASADGGDIWLPMALSEFEGPYPDLPTADPSSATPKSSETSGPTDTATPTPTTGPTATPTLAGEPVPYPTDADTIILQIGWTGGDDEGAVWEELNGTPWFTVYGDRRVIAGRKIRDLDQPLFEGVVSEHTLQRWLRELVHHVDLFEMQESYLHNYDGRPEVHVYMVTADDQKRVSLRGFDAFEDRGAPDFPEDEELISRLVTFVRTLESRLQGELGEVVAEPFQPECYTFLAQDTRRSPLLSDPPKWEGPSSPVGIARAAPTAASNYLDRVPGHRFLNGEQGREAREYVVPIAKMWFPLSKRASEFALGGARYSIGVRQEVPGGSLFLPNNREDQRGSYWYRRDAGSGSCPSLPIRRPPRLDAEDPVPLLRAVRVLPGAARAPGDYYEQEWRLRQRPPTAPRHVVAPIGVFSPRDLPATVALRP